MKRSVINEFWSDESGATMVEYGLMVALIAVAAAAAVSSFGRGVRDDLFQFAVDNFPRT